MKTPTPLKNILSSNPSTQRLIQQANNLKRLNHLLSGILPTPIAQHYKIATLEQGTLTILCSSSVWATRLRLQQAKIIKGFRDFQIHTLTIQIAPIKADNHINKTNKSVTTMSQQTSNLLIELSEATSDPKLKQALQRLSRRTKNSS